MAKCVEHDRERSRCAICSPESVYAAYQRQAKARNLTFTLTSQEFEALVNARCHWCGRYEANGLDRKDNRIGYVKNENVNNVVPCCWRCNRAKGSLSEHEWLDLCRTVCANQEKKIKLAEQKLAALPPVAA